MIFICFVVKLNEFYVLDVIVYGGQWYIFFFYLIIFDFKVSDRDVCCDEGFSLWIIYNIKIIDMEYMCDLCGI